MMSHQTRIRRGVSLLHRIQVGSLTTSWPLQQHGLQLRRYFHHAIDDTPLIQHLKTKILMRGGPISLAEYMQDVLVHPQGGFYMSRDVFGSTGDFITSPEISQMFGEMIGIWATYTWMQLGQPQQLNLVELGPGRGTLMADLLRGTARFGAFSASLDVHLVEVSPALRRLQWQALKCTQSKLALPGSSLSAAQQPAVGQSMISNSQVMWHASLDAVPRQAPTLYLAHEFFDALPVHQFVKDPKRGWLEKMVDVDMGTDSADATADGTAAATASAAAATAEGQDATKSPCSHFRLVLSPNITPAAALLVPRRLAGLTGAPAPAKPSGSVQQAAPQAAAAGPLTASERSGHKADPSALEVSAQGMAAAEALAMRVAEHAGAALVIDYGQDGPYTDSLMAIRNHKGVDILDQPGSADLSAWVDFSSLRQAVQDSRAAAVCHGPVSQAQFLKQLGIETRLQMLLQKATPEQAQVLQEGCRRLIDEGPDGMGRTYKVMAIASSSLPAPVGFLPDASESESAAADS